MEEEILKRGGRRPPRTNCRICGASELYERQALCPKCFLARVSRNYQQRQLKKASNYPPIENLDGEEWKEISGCLGYLISSHGRVKCLNFKEQQRLGIMKVREARRGSYLKIDLDKYDYRPSVHKLVATHFVPNPNNYPIILHKDDNKQNNHKDNLEWGTHSKNRKDYIAYTDRVGIERKKMCKEKILNIFNSADSVQAIAIQYSVSPSTVWMIKSGYRWSSVTGLKSIDKRKHDKTAKY